SDDFPTPEMPSTPALDLFKDATKNMGLNPFQGPSANGSEPYENPDGKRMNACQLNGLCERFGCEYEAKSSPILTVISTANETGNFELRTNCDVFKIIHKNGIAESVMYVDLFTEK